MLSCCAGKGKGAYYPAPGVCQAVAGRQVHAGVHVSVPRVLGDLGTAPWSSVENEKWAETGALPSIEWAKRELFSMPFFCGNDQRQRRQASNDE